MNAIDYTFLFTLAACYWAIITAILLERSTKRKNLWWANRVAAIIDRYYAEHQAQHKSCITVLELIRLMEEYRDAS